VQTVLKSRGAKKNDFIRYRYKYILNEILEKRIFLKNRIYPRKMDMKIEKTGFYGKKKDDKNELFKSSFYEKYL